MFAAGRIEVRALEDIAPGTELTLARAPLHLPCLERRRLLSREHHLGEAPHNIRPHALPIQATSAFGDCVYGRLIAPEDAMPLVSGVSDEVLFSVRSGDAHQLASAHGSSSGSECASSCQPPVSTAQNLDGSSGSCCWVELRREGANEAGPGVRNVSEQSLLDMVQQNGRRSHTLVRLCLCPSKFAAIPIRNHLKSSVWSSNCNRACVCCMQQLMQQIVCRWRSTAGWLRRTAGTGSASHKVADREPGGRKWPWAQRTWPCACAGPSTLRSISRAARLASCSHTF